MQTMMTASLRNMCNNVISARIPLTRVKLRSDRVYSVSPCLGRPANSSVVRQLTAPSGLHNTSEWVALSPRAFGLSFLAHAMQTSAYPISLSNNARMGFSFSIDNETAFIAIRDFTIAALILQYSGKDAAAPALLPVWLRLATQL